LPQPPAKNLGVESDLILLGKKLIDLKIQSYQESNFFRTSISINMSSGRGAFHDIDSPEIG